jgi:hypothetical protein
MEMASPTYIIPPLKQFTIDIARILVIITLLYFQKPGFGNREREYPRYAKHLRSD